MALEIILRAVQERNRRFIIFTENQAAIRAVTNPIGQSGLFLLIGIVIDLLEL